MPRKIFLVLVIMLACIGSLWAQCVQNVLVLEYRGDKTKTPLANVEVVVANAGTTVTNKEGRCTLNFRTLKPGDKVTVRRIDRPGYEVFNKDVVDRWYISREGHEFVIVMCSQKRMVQTRAQYHKAANENLMRALTKKESEVSLQLKDGLITRQEYERRFADIRREYELKLESIDSYIDHLAHTDLSEVDATEKKVLDMVKHGDILGALAAYESVDLVNNYQQEVLAKNTLEQDVEKIRDRMNVSAEARNRIYESVKRQNALLQVAGGEANIEKGMKLLHDISMADTTNYLALLDYAQYAMQSTRDDDAEQALRYCFNSPDTIMRMKARMMECEIMNKRKQWKQTAPELESMYVYLKQQSDDRKAPDLYLEERAYCLYLLTPALSNTLDSIKAGKYEKEMVAQQRLLYEMKVNDESKRGLVNVLRAAYSNAARSLDTRELDAFRYLNEAIDLQEELYNDDPSRQTAMLAFLHSQMASFCRQSKPSGIDYKKAIDEYTKAAMFYEEAFEKNPKAYIGFLSRLYSNFAGVYIFSLKDEIAQVLPLLKKAEYYNNEETRIMGKMNEVNVGYAEWFYGYYYSAMDMPKETLEHLTKAEALFSALAKKNPAAYNGTAALIRRNIEAINQKLNQ